MRTSKLLGGLLFVIATLICSKVSAETTINHAQVDKKEAYRLYYEELTKLVKANKDADAVKWIEKNFDKFPEKIEAMTFNMAYLCGKLNSPEKGILYLQKAHKKGYWFNIWALEGPAFEPYKKSNSFKKIIERNNKLKDAAETKAIYKIKIVLPEGYDSTKKIPLFIALHGGGENMENFSLQWKSEGMEKEYIIAYIQSSQMASMDGYHWEDQEKAGVDISRAYKDILAQYPVEERQVVIGGFSSGGGAALAHTFLETLPVKGFIVLCPPVPENISEKAIDNLKKKGVRGTIITTGRDTRIKEQKELIEKFKRIGFQCQLSYSEKDGHWYPADLSARIDQSLDHINNQ